MAAWTIPSRTRELPTGRPTTIAFCAIRFQSVTALPCAAAVADVPDVPCAIAAIAATESASADALISERKGERVFMTTPPHAKGFEAHRHAREWVPSTTSVQVRISVTDSA